MPAAVPQSDSPNLTCMELFVTSTQSLLCCNKLPLLQVQLVNPQASFFMDFLSRTDNLVHKRLEQQAIVCTLTSKSQGPATSLQVYI